jgi:hypothetical protein
MEKEMTERIAFESPVKLQVGSDKTLRTVKTVEGACEVLIDWPHARRGPVYQSTREVLEAASDGKATAAEAREAFTELAAHAGVLVDE